MWRMLAVVVVLLVPMHAQAAQICGWLVESNESDDERLVSLWLQSDKDIDFLYKIGGRGIVTDSGESNSPSTASDTLRAGQADSPWHFGSALNPPGHIDVTVEIHKKPADVFSDAPTPLLAKFAFERAVPASEKAPPKTLAKKQCVKTPGGG